MSHPSDLRRGVRSGRLVAVLTAAVVTLAAAGAVPAHADDGGADPCAGQHHDPGGVKLLATQDGQVLTGTDAGDVLDANGHRGVTVAGNGGRDLICGGPGDDVLNGGEGSDWIQGLGGDDVIHGDGGDDFVFGNGGDDQAFGDAGDDYVVVSNGPYGETTGPSDDVDVADGGEGNDGLEIDARLTGSASMSIDASAGTAEVPHAMSVAFASFENYSGPGRRTTFRGTPGDDVLYGGFSQAFMGAGDDDVEMGPGGVVHAGPGDDRIAVTDQGTVHGGAGNDRLQLTFEETSTPHGVTTFAGGSGDDALSIQSFYSSGRVWDADPVDGRFRGGPGTDVIDLEGLHFGLRADLGRQIATWRESRLSWSHVETFDGSARADRIRGSAGDDVISSGGGTDVVHALGGDDDIHGGGSRDVVWGGPGHDTCRAEVRHLCEAE